MKKALKKTNLEKDENVKVVSSNKIKNFNGTGSVLPTKQKKEKETEKTVNKLKLFDEDKNDKSSLNGKKKKKSKNVVDAEEPKAKRSNLDKVSFYICNLDSRFKKID